MLLLLHYLECQAFVFEAFMNAGEVALQLQHQPGKGVGIKAVVKEVITVNPQGAAEVHKLRLALEDVRVIRQLGVLQLFLIIFVAYLANDFLQYVLKGDDAAGAAIFINDDGHVYLVRLKLLQQVVNLLRLRNEIRRSHQALPAEIGWLADMLQQVFDIEHTADIVDVVLINRDAAVAIVDDALYDVLGTAGCRGVFYS